MFASQLSTPKASTSESNVPLCDRITQMEGMVLGFVVENNLPFSTAEKIVELANEMMRDPHAAKKLKLARTTDTFASFVYRYEQLILLVSYFCELRKEIIVEHLASVNIHIVNAETVYASQE